MCQQIYKTKLSNFNFNVTSVQVVVADCCIQSTLSETPSPSDTCSSVLFILLLDSPAPQLEIRSLLRPGSRPNKTKSGNTEGLLQNLPQGEN